MIKMISPRRTRIQTEIQMKATVNAGINGLVFACVEQDGDQYRLVTYWNIDGDAVIGQRNVPSFMMLVKGEIVAGG